MIIAAIPLAVAAVSYGAAALAYKTDLISWNKALFTAFTPTTLAFSAVLITGACLALFTPYVFLFTMIAAAILITLPLAVFLYTYRKEREVERENILLQDQFFFNQSRAFIDALPEGHDKNRGEKLLSHRQDILYSYEKLKLKLSRLTGLPI